MNDKQLSDLMGDFQGTFPFEPHFLEVNGVRLHYVEQGDGPAIVLLHGNPTWSYLYRNMIPPLANAGFRAIAFDHLGFGRSDKPHDARYVLKTHVDNAAAFLDAMDLRDATLVMQDWGGPIGCGAAVAHPARIRSLVIMNTWAWVLPEGVVPPFLAQFRERGLGELLQLAGNLFVESIPGGIFRKDRISETMMDAYRAPFPDHTSRAAVLQFPRDIPFGDSERSAPMMKSITDGLRNMDLDVLLLWGMEDRIFPPFFMEAWKDIFSEAKVVEVLGAAHYLQEDAPDELAAAIIDFLG